MHCCTTLHGHRMVQSPLLQKVWVRVCAMARLTITHHLQCHPTKLLDRYLVGSPKSHERKGANTPPAYELKLPTTLPPREQIMRSTTNKKVFLELLSKCTMREEIEITGKRYRDYDHEEAGITMLGSALEKISNGAKNVFVTTNDTDVLILLIYFIQKKTDRKNLHTFKAFWRPGHRCEGIYHHAWSQMFLFAWTA